MTTTVELTSKPLKLALALTGTAFAVSFCTTIYSFGETDMSTARWFLATVITGVIYQLCRAARWWQHG